MMIIKKEIILISLLLLLGCGNCSEKNDRFENLPRFKVDEKIKYRIWYGNNIYDFIDVSHAQCAFIEETLACKFIDKSPIVKLSLGKSMVQRDYLKIKKEKSTWYLCDIYREPEHWYLMVGNNIVWVK